MTEPKLIKAGDKRVLLGYAKMPPKVDVRVIAEDNYQELKKVFDLYNVSQQRELLELVTEIANSNQVYSNTRHKLWAKKLISSNCG